MANQSPSRVRQTQALERVQRAEHPTLSLPLFGSIPIPPPDRLAYYAAIGALAALEIIEWPIALALGAGHALATNHHNRTLQELGEALEDA